MNNYEKTYTMLQEKTGLSDEELNKRIKLAQMWHNPLNYSSGKDLKKKYGWDIIFTEALTKEGMGRRRYFEFHEHDMTDVNKVFNNFRNCRNWDRYKTIWKKYAPKEIKAEAYYILAVTEMSVKGFKHEKKELDRLRKSGKTVRESTYEEDLRGIDAWVDGKPIQIKSPATQAMMDREVLIGKY